MHTQYVELTDEEFDAVKVFRKSGKSLDWVSPSPLILGQVVHEVVQQALECTFEDSDLLESFNQGVIRPEDVIWFEDGID